MAAREHKVPEEYVRDSIESSLGLSVSDRSLLLKLLASEDRRRRLQDHIFSLEEDLRASARRIHLLKAESTMNAAGLRRCVEEKEAMATTYNDLSSHSAKLERECSLYERAIESCDDLARENDELRARLNDNADLAALTDQVQALQKDKENLRINLNKAEVEHDYSSDQGYQGRYLGIQAAGGGRRGRSPRA